MLYEKFPELKYKYRNRGNSGAVGTMWTRQGKIAKKIQEYIQCQYEQDKAGEQLTMPNF